MSLETGRWLWNERKHSALDGRHEELDCETYVYQGKMDRPVNCEETAWTIVHQQIWIRVNSQVFRSLSWQFQTREGSWWGWLERITLISNNWLEPGACGIYIQRHPSETHFRLFQLCCMRIQYRWTIEKTIEFFLLYATPFCKRRKADHQISSRIIRDL